MKGRLFSSGAVGMLVSMKLMAISDPVSWSLNPSSGFTPTSVGSHAEVIYTLTNNIPVSTTILTEIQASGGNFHIIDGCSHAYLATNASCTIRIIFEPVAVGRSSLQLTYGYDKNRIPLAVLNAEGI